MVCHGIVGNAQAAVAVLIRPGNGHKRHIAADVAIPIQIGQRTQNGGHELHQAARLELALVITDMPAVIGEALLLGVTLHYLNAGADHQTAANLHILHFSLAGGQSLIQQLREARTEAVIHPIAGLNGARGHFRCYIIDSLTHCFQFPF